MADETEAAAEAKTSSEAATDVEDEATETETEAAEADPDSPDSGEPAGTDEPDEPDEDEPDEPDEDATTEEPPATAPAPRFTATRLVVALLLGLLGFSFAVQIRSVADAPAAAALDEEDQVRILANLDAHEERLREEIRELEDTRTRLSTAGQSQQEALAEATRRADELGILAGTLPAEGPGVVVQFSGAPGVISAAGLLDAVQELRSAGAEAMQIEGATGGAVRVVASTYFVDRDGGVVVDGTLLTGSYRIVAIGDPLTLAPALHIPGGVVASVQGDGGTVTVQEEPGGVHVSTVRQPDTLDHARPDS
jgi:uncharacterized protein YlxW (UPF0749 family)